MVLSHFDSRFDVLHLSVTCRAAQTLFLPYVLSDVVIDQWELPVVQGGDEEQLAAFCAFMLADVPHRMPLLTSLNLTKDAFKFRPSGSDVHEDKHITDYSAASQLALVIRLSTHLRQLSIFDADGVFSEVPELGDAVAELAHLDDIHFPMTCDATIGVFSRMKSRPRKVECYILQWDAGLNRGDDRFLGNFATSLTTLRLHRHPEVILALAPNTVWPAVANLDLENREPFFMDNWAHFARAFPNVRRLKVFDPSYGCGPSPSVPEAAEHWRNLDFVSISSPLPVRRPIRHLHYSALPSTTTHSLPDHQYADDTQEFLRQSSPVVLSCHAQVKLVEWVAAASVPSLRVLQLQCVPAARVSCPDHMRCVIDMFCPCVTPLQLRAISFDLAFTIPVDDASLLRHAAAAARYVPTLHYIGIQPLVQALRNIDKQQHERQSQWDVFRYKWARVVSRPEQGRPIVEMVPGYAVDALERTLLATPRE
ncbi:uncharacterized protein B0H18DRAFT_497100 [Fomitopsis serialis]|uniref:uncharacterized protein n=1 Tax=Fomitopsis serialis TaxID=139415 RepID=UPI00200749C1|nr:uncharacterized protein B0H18DRAFT_497100 [Neoantrodia serialis]KAH9922910.1 hypothetical protein B0H18DRAFT_497100 [Neoantrodia serialis]